MKKLPHLLLACALVACGGDGGGSGVDSGVSAAKKGNELTPAEETALCEAAVDHYASVVTAADVENFACVTAGATAAAAGDGSVMSCQIVYDMCIAMDPEPTDNPGTGCTLTFELSTCTASVAEIEACLTARNIAAGEAFREASCDDLATPADPNPEPADLPECSKIATTCPGV